MGLLKLFDYFEFSRWLHAAADVSCCPTHFAPHFFCVISPLQLPQLLPQLRSLRMAPFIDSHTAQRLQCNFPFCHSPWLFVRQRCPIILSPSAHCKNSAVLLVVSLLIIGFCDVFWERFETIGQFICMETWFTWLLSCCTTCTKSGSRSCTSTTAYYFVNIPPAQREPAPPPSIKCLHFAGCQGLHFTVFGSPQGGKGGKKLPVRGYPPQKNR